jgi:hypothetical protein
MARTMKLPPLPPLPVDAWQPQLPAPSSSVPPRSAPIRKRVLQRSAAKHPDEDEATTPGHFDLRDPRIFRSERPGALELPDADEDDATRVEPPAWLASEKILGWGDDEEPTTSYQPQVFAPMGLPFFLGEDFEATRVDAPQKLADQPPAARSSNGLAPPAHESARRSSGSERRLLVATTPRRGDAHRAPKSQHLVRPKGPNALFVGSLVGLVTLALALRGVALEAALLAAWKRWFG